MHQVVVHWFNIPSSLIRKGKQGLITLEQIVQLASHNVAILFGVVDRGYVREGNWADLVLVDRNKSQTVSKENILYKWRMESF